MHLFYSKSGKKFIGDLLFGDCPNHGAAIPEALGTAASQNLNVDAKRADDAKRNSGSSSEDTLSALAYLMALCCEVSGMPVPVFAT
jgi:hypothetical protein